MNTTGLVEVLTCVQGDLLPEVLVQLESANLASKQVAEEREKKEKEFAKAKFLDDGASTLRRQGQPAAEAAGARRQSRGTCARHFPSLRRGDMRAFGVLVVRCCGGVRRDGSQVQHGGGRRAQGAAPAGPPGESEASGACLGRR